ncbi:MAG: hypothetical protein CSA75_00905 [Sorangium cellulosum]|nr:MAG: hypothetical protein CSA75_00905 [Sorangium cellulosum]
MPLRKPVDTVHERGFPPLPCVLGVLQQRSVHIIAMEGLEGGSLCGDVKRRGGAQPRYSLLFLLRDGVVAHLTHADESHGVRKRNRRS